MSEELTPTEEARAARAGAATWRLDDEVGGPEALRAIVAELYAQLYDDLLVGFLFEPFDQAQLVAHQLDYLRAHLGDRSGRYTARSMRQAHQSLPILPGHFDRRHHLLKATLARHDVPAHVQEAWLGLDLALRPFVLNLGATARDALLSPRQDT